jgi:hypothetical protein
VQRVVEGQAETANVSGVAQVNRQDNRCPFHEKASFVKAAVAAHPLRDLPSQTFCLASIRTLLSRCRLGAC